MYDTVVHAINRLSAIHGALSCEPSIRPDLSDLSHSDLPIVMLALMNRGVRTMTEMFMYLDAHKAPFDIEDLDAALFALQGVDLSWHLWRPDGDGGYHPLISVG